MQPHDHRFLDDLANALRRHRFGLVRPLWNDLPPEARAARGEAAAQLVRFLENNGFAITRKGGSPDADQDRSH